MSVKLISLKNVLQSLFNKVLALSETFHRSDQPTQFDPIEGYKSWKTERGGNDKGGGGLNMLYKESLTTHEWNPIVPPNLSYIQNERQWLLLDSKEKKCAFLHVYIACDSSNNDSCMQWNEDLFFLLTQESMKLKRQGFIVISLGDFNSRIGIQQGLEFNTPDTNRNAPMFLNFVSEVNLMIMNTLPISKGTFTRFMDSSGNPGSQSLLDYGLIDAEFSHTVTSFVIDYDARVECGSDHALLECEIVFDHFPHIAWAYQDAIHYNLKEHTDFTEFKSLIDQTTVTVPLSQFSKLNTTQMLPHLTESLNQSAVKCFGLKVKRKKTGRKLPRSLIDLIKTKNDIAKNLINQSGSLNATTTETLQQELKDLKQKIKDSKADFLLDRRHRLRSKLLLADPTRKKFWRFLKSQIKAVGNISALQNKEEIMVFEQHQIEEVVLQHFSTIFEGKRHPVFINKEPLDHNLIALQELDEILKEEASNFTPTQFEEKVCPPFTFTELEQTLGSLPNGKATGYDRVPNEIIKNSSFLFKQYLLVFFNQIISDGSVPESLNQGRCILIYKVCSN